MSRPIRPGDGGPTSERIAAALSLLRVSAWRVILVVPGGFLLLPIVFANDRPQS